MEVPAQFLKSSGVAAGVLYVLGLVAGEDLGLDGGLDALGQATTDVRLGDRGSVLF